METTWRSASRSEVSLSARRLASRPDHAASLHSVVLAGLCLERTKRAILTLLSYYYKVFWIKDSRIVGRFVGIPVGIICLSFSLSEKQTRPGDPSEFIRQKNLHRDRTTFIRSCHFEIARRDWETNMHQETKLNELRRSLEVTGRAFAHFPRLCALPGHLKDDSAWH